MSCGFTSDLVLSYPSLIDAPGSLGRSGDAERRRRRRRTAPEENSHPVAWPNGTASDYDYDDQEIAGSIPVVAFLKSEDEEDGEGGKVGCGDEGGARWYGERWMAWFVDCWIDVGGNQANTVIRGSWIA